MFPSGIFWKYENNGDISRVLTDGIKNNGWIKSTFKSLQKCNSELVLSNIFIKMSDEYIEKIIDIHEINYLTYNCKSPYYVEILDGIVPNSLEPLYANNLKLVLKQTGIIYENNINAIINNIFKYLNKQLKNNLIKLNYLLSLETDESEKCEHNIKLTNVKKRIENIKYQTKTIECKLRQLDSELIEDECPICMKILKKKEPCLLMCCKNFICFTCISECISKDIINCPLCRSNFKEEHIIKFGKRSTYAKERYNKLNTIYNIIEKSIHNKNFRCLIFSSYDESFEDLEQLLKKNVSMMHTFKKVNKLELELINSYNNGKKKILFLNAKQYACGINLIITTDIIIFIE